MAEPHPPTPSGRASWMVGSKQPEFAVDELKSRFTRDPRTTLERVVRLSNNTEVLVVAMDDETAQRYQNEFGDKYQFERNLPLHPLGNSS
jgi:hypothetical protein